MKKFLKQNSLSIVLFGLFFIFLIGLSLFFAAFTLHALSGTAAANEEALLHHKQTMDVLEYMSSSQFWFESFQNWQSEFLAVGSLLVLSIFLRQRGSPQSKPIGESNQTTAN